MAASPRSKQVELATGLAYYLSVSARGTYDDATNVRLRCVSEMIHRTLSFIVETSPGFAGRSAGELLEVLKEEAAVGQCKSELEWAAIECGKNETLRPIE